MTLESQSIDIEPDRPLPVSLTNHVARVVLAVFLLTFISSRVMVILIMAEWVPDFFLHMGGTHVHHLNYGIFLLSAVGAYLLFRRPGGGKLSASAIAYGAGLALTFDEFGMWLHLGGSYWQRASFDAVVVIATVLGLIAYAPSIRNFRPRHWVWTGILGAAVLLFALAVGMWLHRDFPRFSAFLHRIEQNGPQ